MIVPITAGTSGYSYPEWRGSFYPEDLKPAAMLAYYAARFQTVEINNTFYRMPSAKVVAGWAAEVPDEFRFVLKASRRITHLQRLKDVAEPVGYLLNAAASLGPKLGALLFQTPPNLKLDIARLEALLALIPKGTRAALEFRHPSWHDDAVRNLLRAHDVALVAVDAGEEGVDSPLVATAGWGYLRLRRPEYSDAELGAWADRLRGEGFGDALVFFKHEDAGAGPRLAQRFLAIAAK